MIFDIIVGTFVLGAVGWTGAGASTERPTDPFQSQMTPPPSPFDPAPDPAPVPDPATEALPMPAAPTPGYIQDMVLEQLSCQRSPDPTSVLLAFLQEGLIDPDARIAFDSINCFEIKGAPAIAGMPFQMICASVTDAEAAELQVVYEQDPDYPGYPMISLGTTTDIDALRDWYVGQIGPERLGGVVMDGMYMPVSIPNEVFCDAIFTVE